MPELPEVHTTATILNTLLSGLSITNVWTDYNSPSHTGKDTIKNPLYFSTFRNRVCNTTITHVSRRAKNVLIHLSSGDTILIHMKMTGHLLYGSYTLNGTTWHTTEAGPLEDPYNQYIHCVFSLSNKKRLVLSDVRKFAKVTLITHTELYAHPDLLPLGPEPLSQQYSHTHFYKDILKRPKTPIKSVLLDQTIIAGVGNIYSDEALWLSSIHPLSVPQALPETQTRLLFDSLQKILREGVDFGGDSTSDYRNPYGTPGTFHYRHKAYRQTKKPCEKRKCTGVITRIVVGGRSTHFCPHHQTLYSLPIKHSKRGNTK